DSPCDKVRRLLDRPPPTVRSLIPSSRMPSLKTHRNAEAPSFSLSRPLLLLPPPPSLSPSSPGEVASLVRSSPVPSKAATALPAVAAARLQDTREEEQQGLPSSPLRAAAGVPPPEASAAAAAGGAAGSRRPLSR
ncbi:unnamed protein product, partial [Ectocarpus sp. 12 AP-2014]